MNSLASDVNPRHSTLPTELFRPIVEQLGGHRPTLLALSLCNSDLRRDAERELYARLDESASTAHVTFLTTINGDAHLASLVKEYHCIDIVHHEAPWWNLLYQALRSMNNLKILHFRSFGGDPAAELLVDVPFQLDRLYWGNHCEGEAMTTVLGEQQQLKYLHLESRPGTTFPPICCPQLKELSGNRITLDALFPGRHIEHITWLPNLLEAHVGNRDGAPIYPEFARLKTLSFGGHSARPHFGLIVDHLSQLEKLELVGLISDELPLLKRLERLRELVLSCNCYLSNYYRSIPRAPDERQCMMESLFAWCPNLLRVDMAYEWTAIRGICYHRWSRETTQDPRVIIPVTQGRAL